jgi:hypothetical protein
MTAARCNTGIRPGETTLDIDSSERCAAVITRPSTSGENTKPCTV